MVVGRWVVIEVQRNFRHVAPPGTMPPNIRPVLINAGSPRAHFMVRCVLHLHRGPKRIGTSFTGI